MEMVCSMEDEILVEQEAGEGGHDQSRLHLPKVHSMIEWKVEKV